MDWPSLQHVYIRTPWTALMSLYHLYLPKKKIINFSSSDFHFDLNRTISLEVHPLR